MSSEPQHPEDQPVSDPDEALGAALGAAIDAEVDLPLAPPPVSRIADRAAAKAKTRRVVGTVAASVLLVAGGVIGWSALRDDVPGEVMAIEAGDADESERPDAPAPDGEDSAEAATSELVDPPPDDGASADIPDPSELSTGPVLEWSEISPGFETGGSLRSLGDGRVVVQSWEDGRILVTGDGETWADVPAPEGVQFDRISTDGTGWLASGWTGEEFSGAAVYRSDDNGATWRRIELDVTPAEPIDGGYLTQESHVSSVLLSGDRMVAIVQSFAHVDVEALAADLGLLGADEELIGWGGGGGTISLDIGDPLSPETIEFDIDELDLTPAERTALDAGHGLGRLEVHAGDGSTLTKVGEYSAEGGANAVVTDAGFALTVFGEREPFLLTSADGIDWTEVALPSYFEIAAGVDGSLWGTGWMDGGFSIVSALETGSPTTLATFEGLDPNGLFSVGPGGIAGTAWPSGGMGPRVDANEFDLPTGSVQKDGYELRYGDPEGGISLWDVESDEAIYVFGPETMDDAEAPEGVREIEGDSPDGFAIVFIDPDTGEDLVEFTIDDLLPIFGTVEGFDEPATAPLRRTPWVGWSADGVDWGWEAVDQAFGLDPDAQAWVELAVGDGFVLARVESYEGFDEVESFDADDGRVVTSGSETFESSEPRWFIARVPG